MSNVRIKGISIPIAFQYSYRGIKYGEVEVYFSLKSINKNEIDLLEPGKVLLKKDLNYFLNKNSAGSFEFLIPYKITESKKYEAPHGMKFGIGLVDRNPTTATMLNRIGMIPCGENNLATFINAFSYPNFYIAVRDNRLFLRINSGGGHYCEIPSQNYSHNCWRGFAHPAITLDGPGTPMDYAKLDWEKILSDICQPQEKLSK